MRRIKIDFLRDYKFNICYENRALPGYTTEKIFEPMVARCLPMYWGNPLIAEEFNPRSFLNRSEFSSDEALIEKIIELETRMMPNTWSTCASPILITINQTFIFQPRAAAGFF